MDASAGLQPDPRRDGPGGRGARQVPATLELQGGAADDDGVPGRVTTGDARRSGTLDEGDAHGDFTPQGRRPIRPGRAARQQTPAEAATLSQGIAPAGAQAI